MAAPAPLPGAVGLFTFMGVAACKWPGLSHPWVYRQFTCFLLILVCFPGFFSCVLACVCFHWVLPLFSCWLHSLFHFLFTLLSLFYFFKKCVCFYFAYGCFFVTFFHVLSLAFHCVFARFIILQISSRSLEKKWNKTINVDKMGIWSVKVGILPAKGSNHDIFRDSDLTNWVLD